MAKLYNFVFWQCKNAHERIRFTAFVIVQLYYIFTVTIFDSEVAVNDVISGKKSTDRSTTDRKRLTIIELKNVEDRYIVQ